MLSWPELRAALIRPITNDSFSMRTRNALFNNDVYYFAEIYKLSTQAFLRTTNFGQKSLDELKASLGDLGLPRILPADLKPNPLQNDYDHAPLPYFPISGYRLDDLQWQAGANSWVSERNVQAFVDHNKAAFLELVGDGFEHDIALMIALTPSDAKSGLDTETLRNIFARSGAGAEIKRILARVILGAGSDLDNGPNTL